MKYLMFLRQKMNSSLQVDAAASLSFHTESESMETKRFQFLQSWSLVLKQLKQHTLKTGEVAVN